MSKVETVQKLVRIYKPVAKELKLAAADDRFGDDLSQQEIVNMALAKFLKLDIREFESQVEELDPVKATEIYYNGEDDSEPEEIIPLKEDILGMLVDAMEHKGYTWNQLIASIDDSPKKYHLYKEEVKRRVEADGFEFVESNAD